MVKHKIGDIIWFKKSDISGFTHKRFENVTKINLASGKKKQFMKFVKYY